MIYVTGDTHGIHDYYKLREFAETVPCLNSDDYVIIAGDFGAIWSERTVEDSLAAYEKFPFNVLFVDGNHENFDLINKYPVEEWCGGKIHRITPKIAHLMRGEVYTIGAVTILTLGGATSVDKYMRREGESWWADEAITYADIDNAERNIKRVNGCVDYVITHSCDEKALYYPPLRDRQFQADVYPENLMLNWIEENVEYKHWFFGHYHMDGKLSDKKTVVYNKFHAL